MELKHAKHLALALLTVVILGAGVFTTKVPGQNAPVVEIDVPFDFVVMGRTYAADRYRIERLDRANLDTLVLKSSTGKTLLIFLTQRLSSDAQVGESQLTFRRFGETHFLDSIRASGESYESRLPFVKSDRRRSSVHLAEIVSITKK